MDRLPVGDDVGTGEKSKYMMVSTIAIPRIPMEDDPKGPADVEEDDTLPKLEAEEDEPVEKATDDEVKTLNQKWMDHVKDLAEPVGVQNLTLVEPLRSRHREDVIKVASKLYCRYRAMGVAPLRIHTDRETSFLSRQFQAWCQRMGLYQTMTGGDEGPSNGRIESEVQQVKRRLRLLVKESGLGRNTGQALRGGLVRNDFMRSCRWLASRSSRCCQLEPRSRSRRNGGIEQVLVLWFLLFVL